MFVDCPNCGQRAHKGSIMLKCIYCGYAVLLSTGKVITPGLRIPGPTQKKKPSEIKARCPTCGRELQNMGGILVCTWCMPPPWY